MSWKGLSLKKRWIYRLKVDSDDVCGQLALSKANCVKLEEALRVAQKDAELGSIEAQDFHMQLSASEKEVKRLKLIRLKSVSLGDWNFWE